VSFTAIQIVHPIMSRDYVRFDISEIFLRLICIRAARFAVKNFFSTSAEAEKPYNLVLPDG
jgi:hypothetical protein